MHLYKQLWRHNYMQYENINRQELIHVISNLRQQLAEAKHKPSNNEGNKEDLVDCNDDSEVRNINPAELRLNQIDEKVFRNFIESIPVLIYVFRGSKFFYVNPAFANALGYSRMELQNMNFWDVAH